MCSQISWLKLEAVQKLDRGGGGIFCPPPSQNSIKNGTEIAQALLGSKWLSGSMELRS